MFIGIITGNITNILVYSSLLALFTIFAIVVFIRSKADYYEDVLQKTESVYEFRNAIKTGKVSDKNMMSDKKKIKLGRIGINRGSGASVFFINSLERCQDAHLSPL